VIYEDGRHRIEPCSVLREMQKARGRDAGVVVMAVTMAVMMSVVVWLRKVEGAS